MRITREEAQTLLEGIRAREKRKRKPHHEPLSPSAVPPEEPNPTRNLRILLPLDLWKALHHAAIDLDENVTEVGTRAIREFIERHRGTK